MGPHVLLVTKIDGPTQCCWQIIVMGQYEHVHLVPLMGPCGLFCTYRPFCRGLLQAHHQVCATLCGFLIYHKLNVQPTLWAKQQVHMLFIPWRRSPWMTATGQQYYKSEKPTWLRLATHIAQLRECIASEMVYWQMYWTFFG